MGCVRGDQENYVRIIQVAVLLLQKMGFAVDVAADGEEATNAVASKRYDLILMDLYMPKLDGFETTRKLRSLEMGDDRVPIIATTANVLPGVREKCLDAGMDEFLTKPIRPKDLFSAVEKLTGVAVET